MNELTPDEHRIIVDAIHDSATVVHKGRRMNERIRELALEVFSFKYKTAPNELNPGHHMDHIHKFAELIIEECVNQVKEQYLPVSEDAAMMNDEHWKGYKHCGVDSVVAIKQHFGVED